jgi:putative ABC transport system permease protein
MIFKIFKSELQRNKVINITLFFFIVLSSLLVSSALYLMITLFGGVEQLMEAGDTPHFVQMHAGDVDLEEMESFNDRMDTIDAFQLSKMLSVPGSEIYLDSEDTSEVKSVMDISLVEQNQEFDFLLNMNNQVAEIESGEIGVPVLYKNDKELSLGDHVILKHGDSVKTFTISSFIRDSQMNPALVSSKRFLISHDDFKELEGQYHEYEYLIEYKLKQLEDLDYFSNAYTESQMPNTGPAVDISLFRTINALTDGLVVVLLVFISLLLTLIGIMCLRYTLISTIEEDIREIGVLKAIGIHHRNIQTIYMAKYMGLAGIACAVGYMFSLAANNLFVTNITEYMGGVKPDAGTYLIPVMGVLLIFALIILSTWIILRRCKKLAVVEALTNHQAGKSSMNISGFRLHSLKKIPADLFLGANKVLKNLRSHMLILMIFILSTFIIVVPVNMLTTISSPSFINYMGIGESDLRLDIRKSDDSEDQLGVLLEYIERDLDISEYGVFKTYTMKVLNDEGEIENLPLEVGDPMSFPLDYLEGNPPEEDEVALSFLAAESLEKTVGDQILVSRKGAISMAPISGIYQDITNGGKTAKSGENLTEGNILWYVININLNEGISPNDKMDEYADEFSEIKATGIDEYLEQTLGGTINQLKLVAVFSFLLAIAIAILITALFLKMMLTKESKDIAVMRSIGFNRRNVLRQYMTRILSVLLIGILSGIVLASTFGQSLFGIVSRSFGASSITFIVRPLLAYALLPSILVIAVFITGLVSVNRHRTASISRMLVE